MTTAQPMAQRSNVRSHRDLLVWQKAMDFVDEVYKATDRFPSKEEYRLVSQLVRAAISVPANIAEGSTRATSKDFAYFLNVAEASLAELDTEVEVSRRRGYLADSVADELFGLMDQLSRMITTLRARIITRGHRH